ncbi:encapsidation protein 22K [Bat mastadenovirus A]|uniref:Encapsidation protein 22K n=1 Tax=Bat mastadenovirus A TaxID=1146877 RepID=A0A3G9ENH6_9ADEN|nr:encapsidation protein 22K [Bat mastadenovirus A]
MEDETRSLSVEDISEEELESLPDLSPPASEETRPAKRVPRWDQKSKAPGKTPRSYRSWRAHKFKIMACLGASGGDVAFTRRFMLFREGVNLPNNIVHYYNSRYRSLEAPPHPPAPQPDSRPHHRRGQPGNQAAQEPHLSHPVCHLSAKPGLPHRL